MSAFIRSCLVAILALTLAAPASLANGDVEVTKTGHGTMGSVWKLELDRERRIEVDFEVNSPNKRAGHVWRIVMRHNGTVFFRGTRTADHEGEFEVDKTVTNVAGPDAIRVRAVDRSNGEVVKAAATI